MNVLVAVSRQNLDVKLVTVQVSVLDFREDKCSGIAGHTVKTALKDKLHDTPRLHNVRELGSLSKPRRRLQGENVGKQKV